MMRWRRTILTLGLLLSWGTEGNSAAATVNVDPGKRPLRIRPVSWVRHTENEFRPRWQGTMRIPMSASSDGSDVVVVGNTLSEEAACSDETTSVTVYQLEGSSSTLRPLATLVPNLDPFPETLEDSFDCLRLAVSISQDGKIVAIGLKSIDAVFIFEAENDSRTEWKETQVLVDGASQQLANKTTDDAQYGNGFGESVEIKGSTLVVGAPGRLLEEGTRADPLTGGALDFGDKGNGRVYSYEYSDTEGTFALVSTLSSVFANATEENNNMNNNVDGFIPDSPHFGYEVSLDGEGNQLLVNEPCDCQRPPGEVECIYRVKCVPKVSVYDWDETTLDWAFVDAIEGSIHRQGIDQDDIVVRAIEDVTRVIGTAEIVSDTQVSDLELQRDVTLNTYGLFLGNDRRMLTGPLEWNDPVPSGVIYSQTQNQQGSEIITSWKASGPFIGLFEFSDDDNEWTLRYELLGFETNVFPTAETIGKFGQGFVFVGEDHVVAFENDHLVVYRLPPAELMEQQFRNAKITYGVLGGVALAAFFYFVWIRWPQISMIILSTCFYISHLVYIAVVLSPPNDDMALTKEAEDRMIAFQAERIWLIYHVGMFCTCTLFRWGLAMSWLDEFDSRRSTIFVATVSFLAPTWFRALFSHMGIGVPLDKMQRWQLTKAAFLVSIFETATLLFTAQRLASIAAVTIVYRVSFQRSRFESFRRYDLWTPYYVAVVSLSVAYVVFSGLAVYVSKKPEVNPMADDDVRSCASSVASDERGGEHDYDYDKEDSDVELQPYEEEQEEEYDSDSDSDSSVYERPEDYL